MKINLFILLQKPADQLMVVRRAPLLEDNLIAAI